MNLSPQAQSAQDAARLDSGEFGTQLHNESGIVPVPDSTAPDLSVVTPDTIVDEMTQSAYWLRSYRGPDGDNFRGEVSQVANAINDHEGDTGMRLVFTPDDETFSDEIGFIWKGYTITQYADLDAMTTDREATGADAARAIAAALLAKRDAMVADFKATFTTS